MTDRTLTAVVLLLAHGLAGCAGSAASPTPPGPVPQASAPPSGLSYVDGYTLVGVSLFGMVSETTAAGLTPLAAVTVYCDSCGAFGHTWTKTDTNGYYSFSGDLASGGGLWLSGAPTPLWVEKDGYQDPPELARSPTLPSGPGWREVRITTDTRFDIQLVPR